MTSDLIEISNNQYTPYTMKKNSTFQKQYPISPGQHSLPYKHRYTQTRTQTHTFNGLRHRTIAQSSHPNRCH